MNDRDCYKGQYTTCVIFYSQMNNEELNYRIKYHIYSWTFCKNSAIEQSHLNSKNGNINTLVTENTPR